MRLQRGQPRRSEVSVDSVVLLLNADYEPLNVCDLRRAFRLLFGEKAKVIEYDHTEIRTPTVTLRAPSVIKLQYRIKRPRPRVRLSRREVFARDGHVCVYCGERTQQLTLDHVVPRSTGGRSTWENLVLACMPCNVRKGNRLPDEARMPLIRQPRKPRWMPHSNEGISSVRKASWQRFVDAAYWDVELNE